MEHRTVAVIGGGIAGLVAAERATARGVRAVVFEADTRLGGQIDSVEIGGRSIDVGAESLHVAAPPVRELLRRLDLLDRLVIAAPSSAWIWANQAMHRVPDGVGPVGPTKIGPVLRSRVLSIAGMARAALEPLAPRRTLAEDISVGEFITGRFGSQVTERFVDPLLGTLHSGDVGRLSLHAVAPQVATLAERHRSILLAHRARKDAPAPGFGTFPNGLPELIHRLVQVSGAEIRTSTPVGRLVRSGHRWRILDEDDGVLMVADAVVVAVPAHIAARLLPHDVAEVAQLLASVRTASVATAVLSYPIDAVAPLPAFGATGLLVPSRAGLTLKAATFLGTKWPHLRMDDRVLVRLSAGRAGDGLIEELDDHELIDRMHADLAMITGVSANPLDGHVRRWRESLPQLEVGHLIRVEEIRRRLRKRHPGLVIAGAGMEGPGIAACIRSGEQASLEVLDSFGTLVGSNG